MLNTFPVLNQPVNDSLEENFCHRASKLMIEGLFSEAEAVYAEALQLGFPRAANQYATALDMGWLGYKDSQKAAYIYQDLAYKGHAIAMYNYGMMLSLGRGIRKSTKRGARWIDRAADLGLDIAMTDKALRLAYQSGDNPDYMTAFELLSRASELGDANAIYNLGLFYKNGIYVKRNYRKAVSLFQHAVDNKEENCFAELHLAKCYYTGKGVLKSKKKAMELLSSAIKHGLPKELYPKWLNEI